MHIPTADKKVSSLEIVTVLGLDSVYTVKYTPLPKCKWAYLTVYPESSPVMDSISISKLLG